MVGQYRSGPRRLDLAKASPRQVLASCIAVEMKADEFSGSSDKGQRFAVAKMGSFKPACLPIACVRGVRVSRMKHFDIS